MAPRRETILVCRAQIQKKRDVIPSFVEVDLNLPCSVYRPFTQRQTVCRTSVANVQQVQNIAKRLILFKLKARVIVNRY